MKYRLLKRDQKYLNSFKKYKLKRLCLLTGKMTVLIFQLFDEALPLQIKENEASHSRYYSHIGLTLGT